MLVIYRKKLPYLKATEWTQLKANRLSLNKQNLNLNNTMKDLKQVCLNWFQRIVVEALQLLRIVFHLWKSLPVNNNRKQTFLLICVMNVIQMRSLKSRTSKLWWTLNSSRHVQTKQSTSKRLRRDKLMIFL